MLMIIPVCAVLALVFALYLAGSVRKEEEGTDRMKEIAGAIREGANAFLFSEYKVLVIFAAVLFVVIGVGIGVPGPVDDKGVVHKAVNLGWDRDFSLVDAMAPLLPNMPVHHILDICKNLSPLRQIQINNTQFYLSLFQ